MNGEPTNAELIAAASDLILKMRRIIKATDINDQSDIISTLDVLSEFLAISGGSLLTLADRLGCRDEVHTLVHEGQERMNAAQACHGLSGRP